MSIPTRAELGGLISARLSTDPSFREKLLADPRAALFELIGVKVPDFVTFEVHEETLNNIHLIIPAVASPGEITDEDLELVAGGTCWTNSCTSGP